MQISVSPEVFEALPGMEIVVVAARGVDGAAGAEAALEGWRRAWTSVPAAAGEWPNAQSHPRVQPWREAWKSLGVSGKRFPSSIEALLRRALKGGEPFSIHPLVDFYNGVSLEHVVPAGGFDLAGLDEDLELRRTRPGDTFQALDDAEPIPLEPGEIAWAKGSTVLTRHIVWRQSKQALIEPETQSLVLVSEILAPLPPGTAEAVETSLVSGLEACFGAETVAGRLSAGRPRLSLPLESRD